MLSVEQYPLPHINDLFAGLTGGQKFSKIDLNQAYLQMHVEEESRELLTINTHKGLFRYKRLPFGITSAPSLFQRAMDQMDRKLELHRNADGLSRLPLADPVKEAKVAKIFYFSQVERAPVTAAQVRKGTRNDPILSKVMDFVMTGKGENDDLELKPYVSRRHELSVQSGCLLWGRRVIIPPALRKSVLKQLHAGHCGMVRMKEIARSYFW